MNKYNFKPGDRVQIREWEDMAKEFKVDEVGFLILPVFGPMSLKRKHLCGRTATIDRIEANKRVSLRDWSDTSGDIVWTFTLDMLKPASPTRKVIVTQDGMTTLAKLYENDICVDSATAKCSPDDTYDFAVGAGLAFDRLMKREPVKPKQEPVKLYCVKSYERYWTEGKTYDIDERGHILSDPYRNEVDYFKDYADFKQKHPEMAKYLYPLVVRPAKAGEWVFLIKEPIVNNADHCNGDYAVDYHKGDLVQITHGGGIFPSIKNKRGLYAGFREDEYLVLDGYTEPEKPQPVEMTVAEIEKKLGHAVKVVKESK